ncbi:tubulin-folding cofactor E [Magnolia sinica]|uniref:tubulin-folding cofactor E n=1 Tax=Magnolia sinica TaxID=86752 RepID=UPI002659F84F|nr:tubulin-folding cofactor E [Magnolia sinica]XP_058090069.1 tubulin-folding cofactor E [Magnolia sinica]XP_058090070.1 tubulin-folding cofactor E [Magnolia sinica]
MPDTPEILHISATNAVEPISSNEKPSFKIDQRVHIAGDPRRTGTVKYIGPVEGYSGIWVGVDWDNCDGKHDGSLNGIRYFMAHGEKSGSFVRPQNLSGGISLLDALNFRYRGNSTKEEEDEMYVLSARNNRVAIQLVGKDKLQEKLNRFEELLGVSLSYLGISSTGSPQQIKAAVPNLKLLDLTGNLLTEWKDVGAICEELAALEVLNLSNNVMTHDITDLPLLKNIRILVLNNCGMTWDQVEILKHSLPAVEELHLMENNLRTIMPEPSAAGTYVEGFDLLRLLNLEDNCIDMWDEIVKFSQLRSLQQLHLNKNNLKHIFYPKCIPRCDSLTGNEMQGKGIKPFENLQCLLLGGNKIEDLESVDSLNFFPSLKDVRLSDNPVADPGKGGIPRFVSIARLAKVQILNGSEVSLRERKESEIRYVRLVLSKLQSDNPEEIKRLHPRFTELKELHGIEDEKPSAGKSGPQKMASGLLSITLKCVGASIGEKPPIIKKLPAATTVGKLKALCESFFKLKSIKPKLFLQEEGSPLPLLLDDEMASLTELGIGTGSTILVDEES